MMEQELKAIENFAGRAHAGQRRKFADEPYIRHPVRVMEICQEYSTQLPLLAAALLHDVLEDTAVSEEELLGFLSGQMDMIQARRSFQLVVELTDIYTKQNYPKWNRRKRKALEVKRLSGVSPDAQTVKYADIIDNSIGFVPGQTDFAITFLHECKNLLSQMDKGNRELYLRAKNLVLEKLKEFK